MSVSGNGYGYYANGKTLVDAVSFGERIPYLIRLTNIFTKQRVYSVAQKTV